VVQLPVDRNVRDGQRAQVRLRTRGAQPCHRRAGIRGRVKRSGGPLPIPDANVRGEEVPGGGASRPCAG
jgi:hypothetical protein